MDAAMIDDARKEWMDRGHPADDFSMDKMAELWQQEEQEEMEEQAVGGNFLEEKVRKRARASCICGAYMSVACASVWPSGPAPQHVFPRACRPPPYLVPRASSALSSPQPPLHPRVHLTLTHLPACA